MVCYNCPYTDSLLYLTDPPKVKCTITGEFHYKDFACNCECSRLLRDKTMDEAVKEPEVAILNIFDGTEPINWDDAYINTTTIAPVHVFENHAKILR